MAALGAIGGSSSVSAGGGSLVAAPANDFAGINLNVLQLGGVASAIGASGASVWQLFTWVPSYGTRVETTPRIRKAMFGDGYSQKVADGINNKPETWSLQFIDCPEGEAALIIAFLREHGGTTPFRWAPPGRDEMQFVCEKWSEGLARYGVVDVTLTFEQDYTP